jgi:hypothetical protein
MSPDDDIDMLEQALELGKVTLACQKYMTKYNVSLGDMMQAINHILLEPERDVIFNQIKQAEK